MPDTISTSDALTSRTMELLLDGVIPTEWASTDEIINSKDAEGWVLEICAKANIKLVEAFHINPDATKADSREAYVFPMQPKFQLSKDLQESGCKQWHLVVQTLSDEDAAKAGIKRKKVRYPVHVWVTPEGRPFLMKVKLQGKHRPS